MPPAFPSRGERPTIVPTRKIFLGAIVGGALMLLAAIVLLLAASHPQAEPRGSRASPQARLASALQSGRPALVFMHSLTCESCQEMMGVTAQVMPEFEEDVTLIDVNVDEPANQAILRSEHLQLIPTEVFYDGQGKRQEFVGVMTTQQLRATLNAIRVQ